MNKLPREKRDKIILIAVGTLALCAAFWYFAITAQQAALDKYADSIREAQEKIFKAELQINRAASRQLELAALREQIAQAEARMIPVEQVTGNKWLFDTLVNFIAQHKHDVRPTSLSNDPVVGKQFLLLPKFAYTAAAYDLEMQGYFHAFGRFLADFENSFPYINIQKLQLWPLATPSAGIGPSTDVQDELLGSAEREQLKIAMKVVVLFKPAGSP